MSMPTGHSRPPDPDGHQAAADTTPGAPVPGAGQVATEAAARVRAALDADTCGCDRWAREVTAEDLRAVLDALATTGSGTGSGGGGVGAVEVYVVERDTFDGLYLFTDPAQARRYAALFPTADTADYGPPLDHAAAEKLLAEEQAQRVENGEAQWLCDDCFHTVAGWLAECEEGCAQDLSHDGTCDPYAWSGVLCTRCGDWGRLTELAPENDPHRDTELQPRGSGLGTAHAAAPAVSPTGEPDRTAGVAPADRGSTATARERR